MVVMYDMNLGYSYILDMAAALCSFENYVLWFLMLCYMILVLCYMVYSIVLYM